MSADITVNGLSSWSYWQYCSSNPNYKFMADKAGKRKVTVKIRSENTYAENNGRLVVCDMVTADYTFYPNSTDVGTYKIKNSDTKRIPTQTTPRFPNWYHEYGPVTYKQGTISA